MKILHQLYSFVSRALFSYENEKIESEEGFKRPVQAHMYNTLDQTPVDKTWRPTESSREMKPEVQ